MLCSEASLVNHGNRKVRAVTLRCRSWGCEICNPLRKKQLVEEATAGLPDRLLTLTTRHGAPANADAEAYRLGVWFARLIKAIRREHPGAEIAYFAVREAHKDGWPHLHVLMRGPYIPWDWLRRTWLAISGSPGCDIRKIYNPARCARYVAKYVGKSPHKFASCKRYWSSKGWHLDGTADEAPDLSWDSSWTIVDERLSALAQTYWLKGYEILKGPSLSYFEAQAPP